MKHERIPTEHQENPLDITLKKVRSLIENLPGKELLLKANAVLAIGKIKVHKLPRGLEVSVGRMRGVRRAKALSKSNFTGLVIEGRVSGQSSSQEQTEPHRAGEVNDGMVWITGFPKPSRWLIEMPAQPSFEAVSVHFPAHYLEALAESEPELARRALDLVGESASKLGASSRKQRSLFLKMLQINAEQEGGKLMLESGALELLVESVCPKTDRQKSSNGLLSELAQSVAEIVDLRLAHPPTISDLANALRVSESRLKREFIRQTGTPIGAFVLRRRLNAAKDMISNGLAISRVAAEVGYATPEAFSKAFRREFGCSPSDYRSETT